MIESASQRASPAVPSRHSNALQIEALKMEKSNLRAAAFTDLAACQVSKFHLLIPSRRTLGAVTCAAPWLSWLITTILDINVDPY